jgi:Permuted papain-like amidase enzyme, YaeF/YiiX, C92 family
MIIAARTRRLWRFDPSHLRAGDVVLEMGSGLHSKGIAAADHGDFSHALMWIGGTDFIEAVGEGARVISFARIIVEKRNKWTVLRLVDDAAHADKAAWEARRIAHKGYDLKGAINTKLRIRSKPDHTKLFCSQLVAEAYSRAGVSLVEGVTAEFVTPRMLQNESLLTRVEHPFVEIPREELSAAEAILDRDQAYVGSSMSKEMAAARGAFEAVQARANALSAPQVRGIQFPPGNLSELLEVLQVVRTPAADELADALLEELDKRDYFNLFIEPFIPLKMMLEDSVAKYRAGVLSREEGRALLNKLHIDALRQTSDRFRQNAHVCQDTYARTKQKLWLRLATMYCVNADGVNIALDLASQLETES